MMAEKSPEESIPDPSTQEQASGNWWDSWITSAKSKSAEVYSMVKKDLDEIGTAVKSEASHVFTTTSTVIGKTLKLDEPESPANVMKKSFSTFIGQVSTVLNPEPDDEDDTEVILSSGDTTMLSTYKKELEGLERVDATFLVAASGAEFEAWRATLEGASVSHETAARRLRASPALRDQYRRLVPDAVTHQHFWERYLFRVALLQDRLAAEARRPAQGPAQDPAQSPVQDPVLDHLDLLPHRASQPVTQSPKKVLSGIDSEEPEQTADPEPGDVTVTWEEEDFANNVELTEEQQILLLEEYEREISSRKTSKVKQTRDVTNNNSKTKDNTKQARDNMNNKQIDKNKDGSSPKKAGKSDVCGNNLVEDYFADKEQLKDDASSNSDESWEKEFEIDDVKA